MKLFLRCSVAIVFMLVGHLGFAQCSISSFSVTVKSFKSVAKGCEMTVDITFTGSFNNGNKYAFLHLWESAPVNNYPTILYTAPPTNTQLKDALANIVIEDPGSNNSKLVSQYPIAGQSAIPVVFNGVTYSRTNVNGVFQYKLQNVKLVTSSCGAQVSLKGDVWASQSNDGQVVHCSNKNQINFSFTTPTVSGAIDCGKPRKFSVTVDNSSSTQASQVTYKVYWDDGDKVFEPTTAASGTGNTTTDVVVYTTPNPVSVNAGAIYTSPFMDYLPYSNQNPDATHNLFIEGTATSGQGTINLQGVAIQNSCFALPVRYNYFSASRNNNRKQQVDLEWETAVEQNNKAFYIQRKTDGGWDDIGLVFAASETGNSNTPTAYRFKDQNIFTGQSQYRLLQVDLDGKGTYSEIKMVAGAAAASEIFLFPNPVTGDKTTVLFANAGVRNVYLSDLGGRVVAQFQKVTKGSLDIFGLKKGFYSLKVINTTTGTISMEKLVVQ